MRKIIFLILLFSSFLNYTHALTDEEKFNNPQYQSLTKTIISSRNAWENVYEEGTPEYNREKAKYDKALADRKALEASLDAAKNSSSTSSSGGGGGSSGGSSSTKNIQGAESLGPCTYDVDSGNLNVGQALDSCLAGTSLVDGSNADISSGFGNKIKNWVNNIAIYLGIFAVGSIVYGALMLTLSSGEDEKIKKGKDIIKWGIIGFIGLISVSAIINLIVKIMFSL